MSSVLSSQDASRLRWRCRRGMLENDLFVQRFFAHVGDALTPEHAAGLEPLMDLADNDLLDLFLSRCPPSGALDTPAVHEVLRLARLPLSPRFTQRTP